MGGARWRLAATLAAFATVSLAITPASCATPLASRAGDPPRVYLPAADAADLASGAADHVVRAAFLLPGAPGAMLVRGVPGYADARLAALAALAACADSDAADDALRSVAEWDERHGASGRFSRRTVAADAGARLPAALDAACGPDLRPSLEALRAAADAAAAAALAPLDRLVGYDTGGFFADAAASTASLDHFHAYVDRGAALAEDEPTPTRAGPRAASESSSSSSSSSHGKGEHVDVGVAIAMTPALAAPRGAAAAAAAAADARAGDGARGLRLGGRVPELPPDAVVVMLGEAARAWLPPPPPGTPAPTLAIPSHEMSLLESAAATGSGSGSGSASGSPTTRAWFGRMVFPREDVAHPDGSGVTFREWRERATAAFANGDAAAMRESAAAACAPLPSSSSSSSSSSRRRILEDDASCGAGQMYCWLSCMDAPDADSCEADHEVKCVQASTGLVWPDDLGAQSHCYDCEPTCFAAATPGASSPAGRAGGSTNPFCNDKIAPVSMYMDGFLGWSDPDAPCVAFLHRDATLTSPGLLFAAFFFTVCVGVGVEGLAAARRWRARTLDHVFKDAVATGGHPTAVGAVLRAQTLILYAVQVAAGYVLMLISMTYHSVLFTGVVAGLVVGHAAFNASAPAGGGGASACCQHVATVPRMDEETDEEEKDEEEGTGRETEAQVTLVEAAPDARV